MGLRVFCRRRLIEPVAGLGPIRACRYYFCRCGCRRRKAAEKEKVETDGGDPEDPEDRPFSLELAATPNGQDADERQIGAPCEAEIPAWQMPHLHVEGSMKRRRGRIPKGTSVILPDAGGDLIAGIVANLPVLQKINPSWHLGYSMAVDGVSLKTLYRQVADVGPVVLVVEDSSNCIFGAFLAEGIRPGSRCSGTHESFLFRFPRSAGAWRTEVYSVMHQTITSPPCGIQEAASEQPLEGAHWANYNEALRKCHAWSSTSAPSAGIFCDHLGICIGIDGPALFIDQNLLRGVSWPSRAFGSPCLGAIPQPDFVVRNFEVWHWLPS